ncbi:hypothetical protein BLNAU_11534 [Blattamonas nauphoetae]|uniref:Uncharacterized protein n=1 Tax=Blattamonas nauphoetae TaxID=2049346 RepID=A0ABQ9XPT2_9EUKA|nr:hypothetical protein BLNAU_11534 [Blattamonas nauphoetae]
MSGSRNPHLRLQLVRIREENYILVQQHFLKPPSFPDHSFVSAAEDRIKQNEGKPFFDQTRSNLIEKHALNALRVYYHLFSLDPSHLDSVCGHYTSSPNNLVTDLIRTSLSQYVEESILLSLYIINKNTNQKLDLFVPLHSLRQQRRFTTRAEQTLRQEVARLLPDFLSPTGHTPSSAEDLSPGQRQTEQDCNRERILSIIANHTVLITTHSDLITIVRPGECIVLVDCAPHHPPLPLICVPLPHSATQTPLPNPQTLFPFPVHSFAPAPTFKSIHPQVDVPTSTTHTRDSPHHLLYHHLLFRLPTLPPPRFPIPSLTSYAHRTSLQKSRIVQNSQQPSIPESTQTLSASQKTGFFDRFKRRREKRKEAVSYVYSTDEATKLLHPQPTKSIPQPPPPTQQIAITPFALHRSAVDALALQDKLDTAADVEDFIDSLPPFHSNIIVTIPSEQVSSRNVPISYSFDTVDRSRNHPSFVLDCSTGELMSLQIDLALLLTFINPIRPSDIIAFLHIAIVHCDNIQLAQNILLHSALIDPSLLTTTVFHEIFLSAPFSTFLRGSPQMPLSDLRQITMSTVHSIADQTHIAQAIADDTLSTFGLAGGGSLSSHQAFSQKLMFDGLASSLSHHITGVPTQFSLTPNLLLSPFFHKYRSSRLNVNYTAVNPASDLDSIEHDEQLATRQIVRSFRAQALQIARQQGRLDQSFISFLDTLLGVPPSPTPNISKGLNHNTENSTLLLNILFLIVRFSPPLTRHVLHVLKIANSLLTPSSAHVTFSSLMKQNPFADGLLVATLSPSLPFLVYGHSGESLKRPYSVLLTTSQYLEQKSGAGTLSTTQHSLALDAPGIPPVQHPLSFESVSIPPVPTLTPKSRHPKRITIRKKPKRRQDHENRTANLAAQAERELSPSEPLNFSPQTPLFDPTRTRISLLPTVEKESPITKPDPLNSTTKLRNKRFMQQEALAVENEEYSDSALDASSSSLNREWEDEDDAGRASVLSHKSDALPDELFPRETDSKDMKPKQQDSNGDDVSVSKSTSKNIGTPSLSKIHSQSTSLLKAKKIGQPPRSQDTTLLVLPTHLRSTSTYPVEQTRAISFFFFTIDSITQCIFSSAATSPSTYPLAELQKITRKGFLVSIPPPVYVEQERRCSYLPLSELLRTFSRQLERMQLCLYPIAPQLKRQHEQSPLSEPAKPKAINPLVPPSPLFQMMQVINSMQSAFPPRTPLLTQKRNYLLTKYLLAAEELALPVPPDIQAELPSLISQWNTSSRSISLQMLRRKIFPTHSRSLSSQLAEHDGLSHTQRYLSYRYATTTNQDDPAIDLSDMVRIKPPIV